MADLRPFPAFLGNLGDNPPHNSLTLYKAFLVDPDDFVSPGLRPDPYLIYRTSINVSVP